MIAKTIKYVDYGGNEREETFYFHLTKAELLELNLSKTGGLETLLKRIIDEQDAYQIMILFKEIIMKSYGKRSDDQKRFIKSEEFTREFLETEAFSELITNCLDDPTAAAEFIEGVVNGVMPKA